MIRLSYSLQRDEYVAALQALAESVAAHKDEMRTARRKNYVVAAYYVALALAVIGLMQLFPEAAVGLVMLALVTVLLQSVAKWLIDRTAADDFGAGFEPRRHHQISAEFGVDAVNYVGREHRHSLHWTLLRKLHDLSTVYVLEFVAFDIIIVPKRVFASADEERTWLAKMRGHLPPSP